eukprot:2234364-Amphidinium_carterae.1
MHKVLKQGLGTISIGEQLTPWRAETQESFLISFSKSAKGADGCFTGVRFGSCNIGLAESLSGGLKLR